MTKQKKEEKKETQVTTNHFYKEIWALAIIGFTLFLLAALFSYSPNDPSLSHYSISETRNWMGPVGANIADFLFSCFGKAAWLLVLVAVVTITPFFIKDTREKWQRSHVQIAFGCLLLLLSTCMLLGLIDLHAMEGGITGAVLAAFFSKWVGIPGAFLICAIFMITSLILATPFSITWILSTFRHSTQKTEESSEDTASPGIKPDKINDKTRNKDKQGQDKKISGAEPEQHDLKIVTPPKVKKAEPDEDEKKETPPFEIKAVTDQLVMPPLSFLRDPPDTETEIDRQQYIENSKILEQKLKDFGVSGKVVEICPGPVVTMYEFSPAPGVKINKVASLADDLALALKTHSVRIVAPIPGKAVIGIELANPTRQMVYLKEILASDIFQRGKGELLLALGEDIVGQPVVTDLAKMPHLLIAGATGTGKSVGLNAMICSLLYKLGPDKLRLLMIDPKRIELSLYESIPHLIHPVVSEPKEATRALKWAVMEMERRYQLLEDTHARNLASYNKKAEEPLPLLVIIIDELADLMMVSSKEVESSIARLAQMARAAGIHLLIATQRPSVDVLTGLIKANFPARLSFKVSSKVDSRTILDTMGAERLLGNGDMLFLPPGSSSLERIHGAYISESEILKIVEFLKAQGEPEYDHSVIEPAPDEKESGKNSSGKEFTDEKYDEAIEIVTSSGQASISGLQRRLRVGYNRAARMIEQMERDGIVSPTDGMGRRQVIVRNYDDM